MNAKSKRILDILISSGIDFACSLPCSWLADLINSMENYGEITHVPVTTEEEGIGVCAGSYLAGKKPVLIMQNSGLGRCINALASLNEVYEIPLLMIMSHRGIAGEKIEAQKPMGKHAQGILDVLNISYIDLTEDTISSLGEFSRNCFQSGKPHAVFIKEAV